MSKFNVKVEDGHVQLGVDTNEDGQDVVQAKLSISEAIQEAFQRSEGVAGAELVGFGFEDGMLSIQIDSDKDGENLLELKLDLQEALDEAGIFG